MAVFPQGNAETLRLEAGAEYRAFMHGKLIDLNPRNEPFRGLYLDTQTLTGTSGPKQHTIDLQVRQLSEGTKFNAGQILEGTGTTFGMTSFKYDFSFNNADVVDPASFGDILYNTAKWAKHLKDLYESTTRKIRPRYVVTKLYEGCGLEHNLKPSTLSPEKAYEAFNSLVKRFREEDPTDVYDYAVYPEEIKVYISTDMDELLRQYKVKATHNSIVNPGSITVIDDRVTKVNGIEIEVVDKYIMKSKFGWKTENIGGTDKTVLRESADAKDILCFMVAKPQVGVPAFIADQFILTVVQEKLSGTVNYLNGFREEMGAQAIEPLRRGLACISLDESKADGLALKEINAKPTRGMVEVEAKEPTKQLVK